jgi:hypothetical protein
MEQRAGCQVSATLSQKPAIAFVHQRLLGSSPTQGMVSFELAIWRPIYVESGLVVNVEHPIDLLPNPISDHKLTI